MQGIEGSLTGNDESRAAGGGEEGGDCGRSSARRSVSRTCTAPLWFFLLCGNIETNFDVFMLSGGGTDWNRRAPGAHWGLRAGERGVHLFFMRFSPSVYSEGIRTDVMLYPCFEV